MKTKDVRFWKPRSEWKKEWSRFNRMIHSEPKEPPTKGPASTPLSLEEMQFLARRVGVLSDRKRLAELLVKKPTEGRLLGVIEKLDLQDALREELKTRRKKYAASASSGQAGS